MGLRKNKGPWIVLVLIWAFLACLMCLDYSEATQISVDGQPMPRILTYMMTPPPKSQKALFSSPVCKALGYLNQITVETHYVGLKSPGTTITVEYYNDAREEYGTEVWECTNSLPPHIVSRIESGPDYFLLGKLTNHGPRMRPLGPVMTERGVVPPPATYRTGASITIQDVPRVVTELPEVINEYVFFLYYIKT